MSVEEKTEYGHFELKTSIDSANGDQTNLTESYPRNNAFKMENTVSKAVQVTLGLCISDEEICIDVSSDNYWNLLAEKKRYSYQIYMKHGENNSNSNEIIMGRFHLRIQLSDALKENERLHKEKHSIEQENSCFKHMLEEANSFIEVFKDLADDTGIDVADLHDSTID